MDGRKSRIGQAPVTAVVGEEPGLAEALWAELSGEDDVTLFREQCPFYPELSIRQNAVLLRWSMTPEQRQLFDQLLEATGLREEGWKRPFRKDMVGEKKLWGLALTLLPLPGLVLAVQPLDGMTGKNRDDFARLLALCGQRRLRLVYTARSLAEVQRLEAEQELWVCRQGRFTEVAEQREEAGNHVE